MLNNSFNYGSNFVIYLMPEMKISPLISFCNKLSSQQGDETTVTILLWQWVPSSSCNIISRGSCVTVINSEWFCFIANGTAGGLPCAVRQRVKNGILCWCLGAWGGWELLLAGEACLLAVSGYECLGSHGYSSAAKGHGRVGESWHDSRTERE